MQKPGRVNASEVSGTQKSIGGQRRPCCGWLPEIALHDAQTADCYLPDHPRLELAFISVEDAQFKVLYRVSDTV
jgi:hypothetical protein